MFWTVNVVVSAWTSAHFVQFVWRVLLSIEYLINSEPPSDSGGFQWRWSEGESWTGEILNGGSGGPGRSAFVFEVSRKRIPFSLFASNYPLKIQTRYQVKTHLSQQP